MQLLTTRKLPTAKSASSERIAQRLDRSKVPATPEIFQRYFAPTQQLTEDKDNFREAYNTIQTHPCW